MAVCAGSLLAAAPARAAGLPIQSGGWSWSNPFPQGSELNDVAFHGARGYAVGDEGTLLRSDDGGRTWSALRSGTEYALSRVQEPDPNTVLVTDGCVLRESSDGGTTFRPLPVTKGRCLASFSFISANVGYLERSDGELLFTTDGGRTDEERTHPSAAEHPGEIKFLSSTVGFALASGHSRGEITRTLDGGKTWTTVATSASVLTDLAFVTPRTAYAVGEDGTLLRTSDGGESWQVQPLALPQGARSQSFDHIACSDELHCLMTSESRAYGGSIVVRTSDGGVTGTVADPSEETNINGPGLLGVVAVAFSSPSTAVVVGQEGAIFFSQDGGATFTAPVYRHLAGIPDNRRMRLGRSAKDAYVPAGEGAAGIDATTDGGATWRFLPVPVAGEIVDVAFPSVRVGYVVNSAGKLFKTTTGGSTWSTLASVGRAPSAVLAPNVITVVVLRSGGVTVSRDGGAHFRRFDPPVSVPGRPRPARLSDFNVANGAEVAGGAIFAFGDPIFPLVGHRIYDDSVLESTDDGLSWRRLSSPFAHEPPWAISFLSARSGYEACAARLFFTSNGGRSWREIGSLGARPDIIYPPINLSFSSVRAGYALVDYGGSGETFETLMRTSDGGRSWVPQQLPSVAGLSQVKAGGAVDYAIGELPTAVFTTRSGGRGAHNSRLTLAITGAHRVSAATLRRTGATVRLVGRLRPSLPGTPITIAYSSRHGYYWIHKVATAKAHGVFEVTVRGIHKTTRFVAQWSGTETLGGAGTPAVELIVTR